MKRVGRHRRARKPGRVGARRRARPVGAVAGVVLVLAGALASSSLPIDATGSGQGSGKESAGGSTISPAGLPEPLFQRRIAGRRLQELSSRELATLVQPDGPGTFRVARASTAADPAVVDVRYTVEVENGLPFGLSDTAAVISSTLRDAKGWSAVLGVSLERVDAGADLRVLVATPMTTDELCSPLATKGRVSCRNGGLVVLNARRWAAGVSHYNGAVPLYRRYLINHEVGHALGQQHAECPGTGEPAPVMQQQTYGLDGCRANAWPSVA